jgi:hypothetical protein
MNSLVSGTTLPKVRKKKIVDMSAVCFVSDSPREEKHRDTHLSGTPRSAACLL